MISLIQLLEEILNKPKAIFLAGPAGSGKSYISKLYLPPSYTVINSDDSYEELLKASGIGMKQKNFTPDQLSQASKLQAQARKVTQDKLDKSIEDKNNIIIDGTGGASNPILKKKKQLEDLGYETMMIMVYVSPLLSLERNANRDRTLMPSIVLRTWRDVNKNIETYQQSFGDNFLLINNNIKDTNTSFNSKLLEPYLKGYESMGKPKSPEEKAKSQQDFNNLVKDIENMINNLPTFTDINTIKSRIKSFTNE
jgi:predicted kinase